MRTAGKKGRMARRLVYLCIIVLLGTLVWAMALKTADHIADTSDVLTFAGAAFGGELLLLCVKRIFAKPTNKEGEE